MAILFMDTLERRALHQFPTLPLFKRYVDDCFFLVQNRNEAINVLDTMNAQHAAIKFDIEFPTNGNCLSLLDFKVTLRSEAGPKFEFFKKSAKKDLFVHCKSSIPQTSKIDFIANERKRIRERCTDDTDFDRHNRTFDRILHLNGYPESLIHRTRKWKRNRHQRVQDVAYQYLKMDYVNDDLDRKIRNIFRKEGINIRITRRTKTLRSALRKRRLEGSCALSNCSIRDPKVCFRRNIVYQVRCEKCEQTYIGSTVRPLHIRFKEHLQSSKSSIYRHKNTCDCDSFNVSILSTAEDEPALRLKEALLIRKFRPKINNRLECEGMKDFLFA